MDKIFIIETTKAGKSWISQPFYKTEQEAITAMLKRKSNKCTYAILAFALVLAGCVSMPTTRLTDGKGHTIVCGGETSSVLPVAYVIDKGVDLSCVARAKANGYKPVE